MRDNREISNAKNIPNNICKYSPHEEMEHNSRLPKHELHGVNFFQGGQHGKGQGEGRFTVEKPDDALAQPADQVTIKSDGHANSMGFRCNVIRMTFRLCGLPFKSS